MLTDFIIEQALEHWLNINDANVDGAWHALNAIAPGLATPAESGYSPGFPPTKEGFPGTQALAGIPSGATGPKPRIEFAFVPSAPDQLTLGTAGRARRNFLFQITPVVKQGEIPRLAEPLAEIIVARYPVGLFFIQRNANMLDMGPMLGELATVGMDDDNGNPTDLRLDLDASIDKNVPLPPEGEEQVLRIMSRPQTGPGLLVQDEWRVPVLVRLETFAV